MKPVGYLLNKADGLEGEPGIFYNYIVAGNGLFVKGASPLLEATVLVAEGTVRGLAPLAEEVHLEHGKISRHLYDLAVMVFAGDPFDEYYLAVVWEGRYDLRRPVQERSPGGVHYDVVPGTVLDIHSHGGMSAWFSGTDNRDEQGLKLYCVVGRVNTMLPEALFRVGVYGYFCPLEVEDIFDV